MDIKFCEVTRGTGRIFTRLTLSDASNVASLSAKSKSANGELPAVLVHVGETEYILIVPVVFVKQTVTVSALDADGQSLASAQKTYEPTSTKYLSRANTLIRGKKIKGIRNYDDIHSLPDTRVLVDRIIGDGSGTDIVQGAMVFFGTDGAALRSLKPAIKVLDSDGRTVLDDAWIGMGDSFGTDVSFPGYVVRRVSFSIKIPSSLEYMIVWVFDKGLAPVDGFRTYEAGWMGANRAAWAGSTKPACADSYYDEWFRRTHKATQYVLDDQRSLALESNPTFSIIVPLYKTPPKYFSEMVESVFAQTYAAWELVLVNASPEDEQLSQLAAETERRDRRVTLVTLSENKGITENTAEGIQVAKGEFVCFLDHDDFIEPDLLFEYAKGVNKYPDTDLLYCDEDKYIDGKFEFPFFKPDWSPDLLCTYNYVCHMLTVRKSIIDAWGPLTRKYDGAQDHNMTLRVGEVARNVFHARRVMYHWRASEGSTASSENAKSYTLDAGILALQEHLDRCGINAQAKLDEDPSISNMYYVDYRFPVEPLVSIVIPNKDMVDVLSRCIDSIFAKTTWRNFEIVIVENNSTERQTFDYYNELQSAHSNVRVITVEMNGMFNFAKLINAGFAEARGDYLLMLNNDTEVIENRWLEFMVGPCQRDDVGIVGARLLYPDHTVQHEGVAFHKMGPAHIGQYLPSSHPRFPGSTGTQNLTAVTGACLLTKKSLYWELGGLDEEAFSIDYNDIDYCCRVRKRGLLVVYQSRALLYHYESVSRGDHGKRWKTLLFRQEQGRMMERYPEYYEFGDPYVNPNLRVGGVYRQL